jgi:mRNA deadenylase 3'-5' endonuclease subunit Ccr4
VPLWQLAWS